MQCFKQSKNDTLDFYYVIRTHCFMIIVFMTGLILYCRTSRPTLGEIILIFLKLQCAVSMPKKVLIWTVIAAVY